MKRIVLSIVVLLVLLCGIAVAEETTIVASGECGKNGSNLTWTLDSEGTLTIKGKGEMEDYNVISSPWYSNCKSIKNIMIDEGVTYIGKYAFAWCSSLTNIKLPKNMITFGDHVFYYCSSQKKVYTGSMEGWLNSFFSDWDSTPLCYGGEIFIEDELVTDLVLPESITQINNYAFCGCTNITSIIIPNSVITIGHCAFSNCSCLRNITIPESVTSIGDCAFSCCSSLSSIDLPNGLLSIGGWTFEKCSSLKSINIPKNVKSIGQNAFYNCSSLSNIVLPPSLTSIDYYVFEGCCNLRYIEIPASVIYIGDSAFEGCNNLRNVIFLGENMPFLGTNAILDSPTIYCHKDSEVDEWAMKNGYTIVYLEDHTHSPVTDLAVPATHVTTGFTEGSHCSVCGEVLVAQKVVPIVEVEKVVLPAELEVIEAEAFAGDSFECVVLPEGCKSIGAGAFRDCAQLRFVEIPKSVKFIDGSAFDGCGGLIIVTVPGSEAHCFAQENDITLVLR